MTEEQRLAEAKSCIAQLRALLDVADPTEPDAYDSVMAQIGRSATEFSRYRQDRLARAEKLRRKPTGPEPARVVEYVVRQDAYSVTRVDTIYRKHEATGQWLEIPDSREVGVYRQKSDADMVANALRAADPFCQEDALPFPPMSHERDLEWRDIAPPK